MLLADDHDLFRESISAMVSAEGGVTVVPAADLDEVIARLGDGKFDLVLLDYRMPGMNGLEGLDRTREHAPSTPIALISGTTRRDLAEEALARGAIGFVPKTLGVQALIAAVKLMAEGERFAPLAMLDEAPTLAAILEELTRREMDVLRGICEGKSNKEIGRDLDVQEVTIKLHVKTLSRKLGAKNRTHAAMIARDAGLDVPSREQ
ncbi:response regulator transcription factor [Thioclava sp. FR2]|uniref:response regulator transcription factor n=1 Tax=Thioclava sp. FR2 TaxID=3445780 RepID=UPI003EBA6E37